LPQWFTEFEVEEIVWNIDSNLLLLKVASKDKSLILIYTRSNYKWDLKKEFCIPQGKQLVKAFFSF